MAPEQSSNEGKPSRVRKTSPSEEAAEPTAEGVIECKKIFFYLLRSPTKHYTNTGNSVQICLLWEASMLDAFCHSSKLGRQVFPAAATK